MEINIITLIFVIAIILKFGSHSFLFAIITGCVFIYCFFSQNRQSFSSTNNVIAKNKLLSLGFLISLFSSVINSIFNSDIKYNYVLEVVLYGLLTILGVIIYNKYGTNYILKGFKQIIYILIPLSLLGVWEFISEYNFFLNYVTEVADSMFWNKGINYRISSLFLHPIPCANAFLIGLVLTYFSLERGRFRTISILMMLVGLFLTQSRSSWIAAFLVFLLYNIQKSKNPRILMSKILKGSIFLLGVLIVALQFEVVNEILTKRFTAADSSLNEDYQRIATWIYIYNAFINSNVFQMLFGHGSHACSFVMLKTTLEWEDFNTTDNLYISDIYNFGFIYFIIIIIQAFRMIKQLKYSDKFNTSLIGVVLGSEIVFFFYEPFVHYSMMVLFFLCFGILLASFNKPKNIVNYSKVIQKSE